ncbi:MAG: hypothetical protein Q8P18_18260 [Pseudomonadota bacterium]|nr:hypothetical protein [Pseudomonadota bacterium]
MPTPKKTEPPQQIILPAATVTDLARLHLASRERSSSMLARALSICAGAAIVLGGVALQILRPEQVTLAGTLIVGGLAVAGVGQHVLKGGSG